MSATVVGGDADLQHLKIFSIMFPILEHLEKNVLKIRLEPEFPLIDTKQEVRNFIILKLEKLMNQLLDFSKLHLKSSDSFGPY